MIRTLAIAVSALLLVAGAEAQMRGGGWGRGGGPEFGPGPRRPGGSRSPSGAISAKAGLIVLARGDVRIGDERVTRETLALLPHVPLGGALTIGRGRAEVLLAPERRLYVNTGSAFEMADNSLDTAEIRLLQGSVIVDVADDLKEQTIAVAHDGARFVITKKGRYRFDANVAGAGVLKVFSGEARCESATRSQVVAKRQMATAAGNPVHVELGKFGKNDRDRFDEFVELRSEQLIVAEARQVEAEARRKGWPTLRGRDGGISDASAGRPRLNIP